MDATWVFLPSPLLGPAVWAPVARVLSERGWRTAIGAVPVPAGEGDDVLACFLGGLPDEGDLVLVPHSNAGAYVPELAGDPRVSAAVFVDAVLPPPSGRFPLAPPALLDHLREQVEEDGLLPPWTQWWDETDVDRLFVDAASRAAVERGQQRVALTYLEGVRTIPAGWDDLPAAYLAFGETYAAERDDAAGRGWPVRTLPRAGHLHPLVEPELVAETLVALLAESGLPAPE